MTNYYLLATTLSAVGVVCLTLSGCACGNQVQKMPVTLLEQEASMGEWHTPVILSWHLKAEEGGEPAFFLDSHFVGDGKEGVSNAIELIAKHDKIDILVIAGPFFVTTDSSASLSMLPGLPELEKQLLEVCRQKNIKVERRYPGK